MSTWLPCCFSVFYDYPSWRTGGSPFVPQVPDYFKTHIIHSFLTILNYKTVCACRSSIMDIPPVPNQPKTFKFPQRSFGQKKSEKTFSVFLVRKSNVVTSRRGIIHVCIVAYRDRKLNSSNLDKAVILNGFFNYKDVSVAFKKTTLPGAIVIRWEVKIVVFSMFVLSDAQM